MSDLNERGLPDFESILDGMDRSVRVAWAEKFLKDSPGDPIRGVAPSPGLESRLLDADQACRVVEAELQTRKAEFEAAIEEAVRMGIDRDRAQAFMSQALENALMMAIMEVARARAGRVALAKDVARLQALLKPEDRK